MKNRNIDIDIIFILCFLFLFLYVSRDYSNHMKKDVYKKCKLIVNVGKCDYNKNCLVRFDDDSTTVLQSPKIRNEICENNL